MWRKALGVVGGIAAGMAVTTVAETIEGLLHPIPESVNPLNVESNRVYIARLPPGAFVLVLCGHALGSIAAGAVATLIARRTAVWPAIAAGVVLFFFGAINVLALPHPAWFIGPDLACYIPLAWLGARLVAASSQPPSPAGPAGT